MSLLLLTENVFTNANTLLFLLNYYRGIYKNRKESIVIVINQIYKCIHDNISFKTIQKRVKNT